MIKMTWVSSSLLSAHPQNCHLTGVIGEGGGRTDRLLSKTCFSSNSVLDRKIMIWHWPPGLLSIFLKELPSKKVVIFTWTMRTPKAVVLNLFLRVQRTVDTRLSFSEPEVILSWSPSSSGPRFTSNRAAAGLWQILSIIKCPRGNEPKKQEEYLRHKSCKETTSPHSELLPHRPCHCRQHWMENKSRIWLP